MMMAVKLEILVLYLLLVHLISVFVNSIEFRHTIYGRGGVIYSPNYPQHYPLNTTAIWLISVRYSHTIQVNFTEFNLEKNKKCIYDYVFIQETRVGGGSISRKYCGHKLPPNYSSTSNKIRMVFVSDKFSNVDRGFKASWREVGGSSVDEYIRPTKPGLQSSSSCIPTTVTVSKPCSPVRPTPNVITYTLKRPKCSCTTKTETVTKTVSYTIKVTPSRSLSEVLATSTATDNNVEITRKVREKTPNDVEEVSRCDPASPFSLMDEKKQAAERDASKNLVVSLGVVLIALFITNIFLLVLLCKRERGYNAISFNSLKKYLSGRNRSLPDTPDIFYSTYSRPTLRMINGEIVVVSPSDPNSAETETAEAILADYPEDKQISRTSVDITNQLPELPFHLIPHQQPVSTMNSGTDENTIASTRTELMSDTDNENS